MGLPSVAAVRPGHSNRILFKAIVDFQEVVAQYLLPDLAMIELHLVLRVPLNKSRPMIDALQV